MKKSLIALAVMAAAGVASAQSSVTMYGVMDLGFFDTSAAGVKMSMTSNGAMNNGSSRLGVRGVEDLGGGLKVSFQFEQGINAETGATDAATYQRAATMGISGGFGTVNMGRRLTPSFFGVAAWELTGTANYSVVAGRFGFGGGGPSRNNSEISYTTPKMGGFSATLGMITKTDNGGASKTDANIIYSGGPLTVGFSYNKVQNTSANNSLGVKYNFGMFTIAGSLQDPGGAARGFTLGGQANLGPVSLVLDIARESKVAKTTDYLLEVKYPLSKRTFAYGAYLRNGAQGAKVSNYGFGIRHNF